MRSMVGLSVLLENSKDLSAKRKPQVVSKGSIIKPPSTTTPSPRSPYNNNNNNNNNNGFSSRNKYVSCCFLERCFLCHQKLLPGKDIYMYKGDLGFCSEVCRCRQIFMDEEEIAKSDNTVIEYNCSLAATSSPSSSTGAGAKTARNGLNSSNAFAY